MSAAIAFGGWHIAIPFAIVAPLAIVNIIYDARNKSRALLPEPVILADAFPQAARITARVGANRRDRLTAHLPMLRRPHPEGSLGAIRVEVRGRQGQVQADRVLGAVDRPAVAAGAVAAMAARWAADGRLTRTGAGGLAALADPAPFLAALADRGVKAAIFEGAGASAHQA